MQPQQKLIAMSRAFKFNLVFLCIHAVCNALPSSLCPFKVGYGNLQTMSMDKWAASKSTQLSTKLQSLHNFQQNSVKLLLTRFHQCCVAYLNKADNLTYYSKSDAQYFHLILNKNVVPIILK